jgi:transcriptional regulator NrdR family protein
LLSTAAEKTSQRAEQAENQVNQIAKNLLQAGMDPVQVAQITGLTIGQVKKQSL